MVKYFRRCYRQQMFFPSFIAVFFNPFYFARRNLASAISEFSSNIHGHLLDVGCGTKPYRLLFDVKSYRGLDIDSPSVRDRGIADDLYEGTNFPYQSETFDSVLCNQVLEHVFNPDEFLSEIKRVLRPGGKLLLTVPFVWDEHEQPYDYARYSSFGLRALLEKQGFRVVFHEKLGADPSVLFQLLNAYLFKVTQGFPRSMVLLFTVTVMASVNLLGLIAQALLPRNPDLYLDHVILVEKPV